MKSTTTPAVFQFQSHDVRTILKDGEPWFVAGDVCETLGYRDAATGARWLDDDEKGTHIVRTPGGEQKVTIINESGLYALVLRSRKPEARKFAKWVTSEVLPAIRKTGSYQFSKNAGDVLTIEQADTLRLALTTACSHLPPVKQGPFMRAGWGKLKSHFKVSYRQIPQEQLAEALSMVTRHAAEWEVVDDTPAMDDDTKHNIEALCCHMEFLRSWFARIYPGLKLLSPKLASAAHDHAVDGVCFARALVNTLGLKSHREHAAGYPWDGGFTDRMLYNRSFT